MTPPESLVTGTPAAAGDNPPANDNVNPPAQNTDGNPGTSDDNLDPFKDLDEWKDKESGLYLSKYKSIPEVFKGYTELSGKIREKIPTAPEAYEPIVLGDGFEGELKGLEIKPDEDPGYKRFAPLFKKWNLPQEAVAEIISEKIKFDMEGRVDLAAEKQKLGADADKIINEVNAFEQKTSNAGLKQLAVLAGSNAETLKAFHFVIQSMGEKSIPGGGAVVPTQQGVDELFQAAWDFKKRHKDTIDANPAQQRKYDELLTAAAEAEVRSKKS
jgi:hypothetical protein